MVNTKERFLLRLTPSLPLDPPYVSHNWDALADSLFGGLLSGCATSVDIMWPFANDVTLQFLIVGVKFFRQVAESVRDREDSSVSLRLFLICSNDNSRSTLEAALWSLY